LVPEELEGVEGDTVVLATEEPADEIFGAVR
jgi:hypothetical protein